MAASMRPATAKHQEPDMETVYVLWHHRHDPDGHKHEKLIGIYSSRQKAEVGIAQVRDQPGFKERPKGFRIEDMNLDQN